MPFLPFKYSFCLVSKKELAKDQFVQSEHAVYSVSQKPVSDEKRRLFLRTLGVIGAGAVGASMLPKRADALVMGGTPATSVVGIKNASDVRVNPATEETLASLPNGKVVIKKTIALTASGTVHTPTSGKKIRLYSLRFSLTANMTDVSYRLTSGGTDFEKYMSPRLGGLYGSNSQSNYILGGINEVLYCVINGTGTVQTVIIYDEV